jgi:hypothetical protein
MALTSQDLLGPSASTLYKQYGFRNPNNNVGAMANRLAMSSYDRAAMGAGFATEMEPDRQGAIRALVTNSNPANMVANAHSQGGRIFNQSKEQGGKLASLLGMKGFGAGAQAGAMAHSANQGTEASNNLLLNAYSPQGQNMALMQMLQAITQAPGDGLRELLMLANPVSQKEHDRMAREQSQGLGGLTSLLGMAGQMAGGGGLSALFGGGMNPAVGQAANTAANSIWSLI